MRAVFRPSGLTRSRPATSTPADSSPRGSPGRSIAPAAPTERCRYAPVRAARMFGDPRMALERRAIRRRRTRRRWLAATLAVLAAVGLGGYLLQVRKVPVQLW